MNKFTPWKIENGTLQLLPWEYGAGDVLVTVDVFQPWEGLVLVESGLPAWRYAAHSRETRDIPLRPMEYSEVLSDLFAHIDANPQTTFHLVTEHPERVREVWPAWADHACETGDCPHSKQVECDAGASRFHRPNVTLSLGPLATQADADRLVPEMLPLADLCGGLELYSVPTERINYGQWLLNECPKCGQDADDGPWESRCVSCGSFKTIPPLVPDDANPGYHRADITRIRVDGDRDDNVRCLQDQAIAAGVGFALNWESEGANGF